MNALDEAIELVYSAFADVARPRRIEGCPCCIESKGIERLLAVPLRKISPVELTAYASSALKTVGTVSDYLYFLPRILEVSIREDSWWPDIEVTGAAIHSAGLQSWPQQRQGALVSLISAVIDNAIATGEFRPIDGWLCATARMGCDVRPYLAKLEKSPDALLHYFEDNAACIQKEKLANSFWEPSDEGHAVILQWFKSEAVRQLVLEAYGYAM